MLSVVALCVPMLNSVMLNVVMLSVIMLNVVMLSVIMLNVVTVSFLMLSLIILSVIMLNMVMLRVSILNITAPMFLPQISGSLAHGINGVIQLGRGDLSGIGHVLRQKILVSKLENLFLHSIDARVK